MGLIKNDYYTHRLNVIWKNGESNTGLLFLLSLQPIKSQYGSMKSRMAPGWRLDAEKVLTTSIGAV